LEAWLKEGQRVCQQQTESHRRQQCERRHAAPPGEEQGDDEDHQEGPPGRPGIAGQKQVSRQGDDEQDR